MKRNINLIIIIDNLIKKNVNLIIGKQFLLSELFGLR